MKTLITALILALSASFAHGADDDMTLRLLQYIAGSSRAEATSTGYRLMTPDGTVMARRTGYGWVMPRTGAFPGAELRAQGNGWLVAMAGADIYYRRTTGGYSAEPGQSLRAEPAGASLEASGIEALFQRMRHK